MEIKKFNIRLNNIILNVKKQLQQKTNNKIQKNLVEKMMKICINYKMEVG